MKHIRYSLLALMAASVTAALISMVPGTGKSASASFLVPLKDGGKTLELRAWFSTPAGKGPFATVIIAHGCDGVVRSRDSANRWAEWLNESGFAALILDSFSARGLTMICGHGSTLPIGQRAADIYAAALYLSKLPTVHPQKIGAIGFSHGGSTVLRAVADRPLLNPSQVQARSALAATRSKLSAVVAMYPGCRGDIQSNFFSPVLILIGTGDDWTPHSECQRLLDHPRTSRAPVQMKLYPNATHAFDVPKGARVTPLGYHLRYDEAATADSKRQIKSFFDKNLTGSDDRS